mmetsp:Transcript_1960/g.6157  ORF Transcript_1960/g.6157 Transcript_1960/m.6157 type:complete len:231 (+) Transcript_1960:488-1180(+)
MMGGPRIVTILAGLGGTGGNFSELELARGLSPSSVRVFCLLLPLLLFLRCSLTPSWLLSPLLFFFFFLPSRLLPPEPPPLFFFLLPSWLRFFFLLPSWLFFLLPLSPPPLLLLLLLLLLLPSLATSLSVTLSDAFLVLERSGKSGASRVASTASSSLTICAAVGRKLVSAAQHLCSRSSKGLVSGRPSSGRFPFSTSSQSRSGFESSKGMRCVSSSQKMIAKLYTSARVS